MMLLSIIIAKMISYYVLDYFLEYVYISLRNNFLHSAAISFPFVFLLKNI